MKDFFMGFSVSLLAFLLCLPFLLNTCDREYDFQQAQVKQWQTDLNKSTP